MYIVVKNIFIEKPANSQVPKTIFVKMSISRYNKYPSIQNWLKGLAIEVTLFNNRMLCDVGREGMRSRTSQARALGSRGRVMIMSWLMYGSVSRGNHNQLHGVAARMICHMLKCSPGYVTTKY